MRKFGKWALTLGLLASTPGWSSAAPWNRPDSRPDARQPDARQPAPKQAGVNNQKKAEDIAAALRAAHLQGTDIEIEFRDGIATIRGKVGDLKQKMRATDAIQHVPGVKDVDNRLVVSEPKPTMTDRLGGSQKSATAPQSGPTGRQQSNVVPAGGPERAPQRRGPIQQVNYEEATANNQRMAEQIAGALSGANLDGYDIEIQYQNGLVTLGGQVGNPVQRAAAERVCQQVPGVQQVNNRLTVANGPTAGPQMGPQGPAGYGPQGPAGYGPQGYVPQGPTGYGPQGPAGYGPQGPMGPQVQAQNASFQGGDPTMAPGGAPMGPPPAYGQGGGAAPSSAYNMPNVPEYAWPSYAQYPNSAAVTYPQQYSASAWPYIGPFYPYPQVPLGWRKASLEWDDGQWNLKFRSRTDKWWWFFNPNNW